MKNEVLNKFHNASEQYLHKLLLSLGYPDENIEAGAGYPGTYFPDIIVYSSGLRREPIAIFEVKSHHLTYDSNNIEKVAARMRSSGFNCDAYLFVVEDNGFRVFDCTKRVAKKIDHIPSYRSLEEKLCSKIGHLEYLKLENFTVFKSVNFEFGKRMNLIIAENGLGKSTLLKVLFSEAKYSSDFSWNAKPGSIVKAPYIERFFGVRGSSLVSHGSASQAYVEVGYGYGLKYKSVLSIKKDLVEYKKFPSFKNKIPTVVFIQSHELVTSYQYFSSIANVFDEKMAKDGTILDTVQLLGLPRLKVIPEEYLKLGRKIENEIGGSIEFDKKEGQFFYKVKGWNKDRLSIDMAAEGWRKIGQLLTLIRNGAVSPGSILFWDEPEANLNPKLIKLLVSFLIALSKSGVQVFMTTHSLFFANELEIQAVKNKIDKDVHYINLKVDGAYTCSTALSELEDVSLMNESMSQSDRYMDLDI